jgi:hypothetical protein
LFLVFESIFLQPLPKHPQNHKITLKTKQNKTKFIENKNGENIFIVPKSNFLQLVPYGTTNCINKIM